MTPILLQKPSKLCEIMHELSILSTISLILCYYTPFVFGKYTNYYKCIIFYIRQKNI